MVPPRRAMPVASPEHRDYSNARHAADSGDSSKGRTKPSQRSAASGADTSSNPNYGRLQPGGLLVRGRRAALVPRISSGRPTKVGDRAKAIVGDGPARRVPLQEDLGPLRQEGVEQFGLLRREQRSLAIEANTPPAACPLTRERRFDAAGSTRVPGLPGATSGDCVHPMPLLPKSLRPCSRSDTAPAGDISIARSDMATASCSHPEGGLKRLDPVPTTGYSFNAR